MEESCGIVPVLLLESEPKEARFLLVHQCSGHWAFPKGRRDPGETALAAALRELREETGISEVKIADGYSHIQQYAFEREGRETQKRVEFFLGFVKNDAVQIQEKEIQGYGWFSYEDALERLTFKEGKDLLADVRGYLLSNASAFPKIESRPFTKAADFLGTTVSVTIDRPLSSKHPKHGFAYELNYGFIPGTLSPDGEELDAYVTGVDEPLGSFSGVCIAVIHRTNDDDDKLVMIPEGAAIPSDEEIRSATHFQEQFFESEILREV